MSKDIFIYTKETLIEKLREIRKQGWIESARQGNAGGVGNILGARSVGIEIQKLYVTLLRV